MKQWHKCSRWSDAGFRCPFRLLELDEEREVEESEVPQKHVLERHIAQAEAVGAAVQVSTPRELQLYALSEAVVAASDAGLLNAVSTSVVPPFEAPLNIPTFVAEVAREKISVGSSAQVGTATTVPQATVANVEIPATSKPAPDPRPPPPTTNAAIPRIVELTLIKLLVEATAPAPAEQKPVPDRVGAPYSRLTATDDAKLVAGQNTPPGHLAPIDLTNAYLIEAGLVAAVVYGLSVSIKGALSPSQSADQMFNQRGPNRRIVVPQPRRRNLAPRFNRGGGSSGDMPGNSNLLRDLGASLVERTKRGP